MGIIGDDASEGKCPVDMEWMRAGYKTRWEGYGLPAERNQPRNSQFKAIVYCVLPEWGCGNSRQAADDQM
jgi:hypothetical protein